MRTVAKLAKMSGLSLAIWMTGGVVTADEGRKTVLIDGEEWILSQEAEQCEARVPAAISRYWDSPRYPVERTVEADRFLTNGSNDCWIELVVQGVDDLSLLFKITEDNQATGRRGLSWWGLKVFPYPEGPPLPY